MNREELERLTRVEVKVDVLDEKVDAQALQLQKVEETIRGDIKEQNDRMFALLTKPSLVEKMGAGLFEFVKQHPGKVSAALVGVGGTVAKLLHVI